MKNYISENHSKGKRPIILAKNLVQILGEINSSAAKGEIGKVISLCEQVERTANNYLKTRQIIQRQMLDIAGCKEESFKGNEKYIQGYRQFINQLPDYLGAALIQAEIFR